MKPGLRAILTVFAVQPQLLRNLAYMINSPIVTLSRNDRSIVAVLLSNVGVSVIERAR